MSKVGSIVTELLDQAAQDSKARPGIIVCCLRTSTGNVARVAGMDAGRWHGNRAWTTLAHWSGPCRVLRRIRRS